MYLFHVRPQPPTYPLLVIRGDQYLIMSLDDSYNPSLQKGHKRRAYIHFLIFQVIAREREREKERERERD